MSDDKLEDTIAAIATPVGVGGIAVIRVSGDRTFEIVGKIFHPQKGSLCDFASHTIHYGRIVNEKNDLVDQVLVSLFHQPNSYTGEPVIEISVHGGLVVTQTVLGLLLRQGARMAEPGEFTKRAFLNGKIDLAQAEAVLDLIHARSTKSMETAVRQLAGNLSAEFRLLRDGLLKIHAHLEAFLDFPDEQLEVFSDTQFRSRFEKVRLEIQRLIASFRRGSILREGITVAIAGKPNTGKSSLFNALLERDRAIVSEYPGTTRDTLEEAIEVAGIYVRLMDTAGLTSCMEHPLDQISMQRTREALQHADLCLFLVDGTGPLEDADRMVFKEIGDACEVLTVINKSDLPARLATPELCKLTGTQDFLTISVKQRQGLDQLEQKIAETIVREASAVEGEQVTRLRHLRALEQAARSLAKAEASFVAAESLEYVIVDLKESLDHLSELIGEVYSDDLLDVIFSEFCIGK